MRRGGRPELHVLGRRESQTAWTLASRLSIFTIRDGRTPTTAFPTIGFVGMGSQGFVRAPYTYFGPLAVATFSLSHWMT